VPAAAAGVLDDAEPRQRTGNWPRDPVRDVAVEPRHAPPEERSHDARGRHGPDLLFETRVRLDGQRLHRDDLLRPAVLELIGQGASIDSDCAMTKIL
jgi:hypothetical protein